MHQSLYTALQGAGSIVMNGRERILAALHGDLPDRVPFAPNIYQWFYIKQRQGTLPEEVANFER